MKEKTSGLHEKDLEYPGKLLFYGNRHCCHRKLKDSCLAALFLCSKAYGLRECLLCYKETMNLVAARL
jgi:hypothetical protein